MCTGINCPLTTNPVRTEPTPNHSKSDQRIWDLVRSRVTPDGPVPSNLSMFQSACAIEYLQ